MPRALPWRDDGARAGCPAAARMRSLVEGDSDQGDWRTSETLEQSSCTGEPPWNGSKGGVKKPCWSCHHSITSRRRGCRQTRQTTIGRGVRRCREASQGSIPRCGTLTLRIEFWGGSRLVGRNTPSLVPARPSPDAYPFAECCAHHYSNSSACSIRTSFRGAWR